MTNATRKVLSPQGQLSSTKWLIGQYSHMVKFIYTAPKKL